MKNNKQFFRMMLLLGFSIHFLTQAGAQVSQEKKTMDKIHIKMVKEVNGKKVVIDTLIENNAGFDVDAFLKDNGVEKHDGEGKQGTRDMIIIRHKNTEGDTTIVRDNELLTLPGGRNKIIVRKLNLKPGDPRLHPDSLLPDQLLLDEEKLKAYMEEDTILKNSVIIDGDDLKLMEEREIDVQINEKGGRKEIKMLVLKRVSILTLTDKERKSLNAGSGAGELKVEHIDFYPNPNNGRFNLSFELKETGTTTIEIANKDGKQVYLEKLKDFSGKFSKEIDISSEKQGLYYLTVKQGKKVLMRKLLIE